MLNTEKKEQDEIINKENANSSNSPPVSENRDQDTADAVTLNKSLQKEKEIAKLKAQLETLELTRQQQEAKINQLQEAATVSNNVNNHDENIDEFKNLKEIVSKMEAQLNTTNAQASYIQELQVKDRLHKMKTAGMTDEEITEYVKEVGGIDKLAEGATLSGDQIVNLLTKVRKSLVKQPVPEVKDISPDAKIPKKQDSSNQSTVKKVDNSDIESEFENRFF